MKHKFSLSINWNILKKSKRQLNFHFFIVCVLDSFAFWFSCLQNIVTILISAAFRVASIVRGEALIRGRHLFQYGYPKVRRLSEARRLLEEICYLYLIFQFEYFVLYSSALHSMVFCNRFVFECFVPNIQLLLKTRTY